MGGGAQYSESRCGLTQAAGSEAQEGQEPAALDMSTLQDTHSKCSQEHTMNSKYKDDS